MFEKHRKHLYPNRYYHLLPVAIITSKKKTRSHIFVSPVPVYYFNFKLHQNFNRHEDFNLVHIKKKIVTN